MFQRQITRLLIDSAGRNNGTDSSFKVTLPLEIEYRKVDLRTAVIPISWYIDEVLTITEAGEPDTTFTVNIVGNYSEETFPSYLEGLLNDVGGNGYEVSINSHTYTMTITSDTVGFAIIWSEASERLRSILGGPDDGTDTEQEISHVTGVLNLSGTKVVYIETNMTHGSQLIVNGSHRGYFMVPITKSPSDVEVYQAQYPNTDVASKYSITSVGEVCVSLYDEWFNQLELNGQNVILEFEVTL